MTPKQALKIWIATSQIATKPDTPHGVRNNPTGGITLYRATLLVIQRKTNMTRRQHWAKLAKDFKKNGRPFHYQYLIRKGGD